MSGPHTVVTAPELAPPRGFAHAVVAAPGRTVHLAGQTAERAGTAVSGGFAEQFDAAAANILAALRAAGGEPEHVVWLQVFVTDVAAYRASRAQLAAVWRAHFGRHYPAMALIAVSELVDPAALVEIAGVAVIP